MIKFISFDLWNTILNGDDETQSKRENLRIEIFKRFFIKKGVEFEDSFLIDRYHAIWNYFSHIWLDEKRTPDAVELTKFFLSFFEISYTASECEKLAYDAASVIFKFPPRLTDEYLPSLLELLSENYKLFIISDTAFVSGDMLRKILKRYGILKYFSKTVFSDEVGCSKPCEKIFYEVIENRENAKLLLHIGDFGDTDILGAKKIGAFSVRYDKIRNTPYKDFEADFVMDEWNKLPEIINMINDEKSFFKTKI